MLILSVFLGGALAAAGAPTLTCDANNYISQACSYFEANKAIAEFTLPDGTKFKNPRAEEKFIVSPDKQEKTEQTSYQIDDATLIKLADMAAEFQMQMQATVQKNPKLRNLPERTKFLLLDIHRLNMIFPQQGDPKITSTLTLPWPLQSKTGEVRVMNEEQINQVKSLFTAEQIKIINQYRANVQAVMGASGGGGLMLLTPPTITVTDERRRHLAGLVREAKEKLINFIKQNKNDKDLTEEQKALIQKIDTVRYIAGDSKMATTSSTCLAGNPNAFYNPGAHAFTICDSLANFPDSQVIAIIGHELGHAIDPCRSPDAVYKVTRDPVTTVTSTTLASEAGAKLTSSQTADLRRLNDLLSYSTADGIQSPFLFAGNLSANLQDPKTIEAAERTGRIEKLVNGVPVPRHPFESVRSCLVKDLKFIDVNKQDIDRFVSEVEALKARGERTLTKEDRDWLRQSAAAAAQCLGVGAGGKQPETNEGMSDIYGAAVLSQYLQEHPAKTMVERIAAQSMFLDDTCRQFSSEKPYATANETVNYYRKAVDHFRAEEHPLPRRRIKTLALQFPGVAKGLGCADTIKNVCFKGLKVPVNSTTGSSEKNNPEQGVQ